MAAIANPKHRNLLVILTLTAFVAVACVATDGAQLRDGSRSPVDKAEGIYAALQEPVPQIALHHAIFDRPVQLSDARPVGVDHRGAPSTVPVKLVYASSGVVIGKDLRASRVDVGDTVALGDFIVGGVVENVGSTPVYLSFAGGGEVKLDRGDRLYVGTEARILEPPGAEGGVAASGDKPELLVVVDADGQGHMVFVDANGQVAFADGASPTLPSPSHCSLCNCSCSAGDSCAVTITPDTNSCSGLDGKRCRCTSGGSVGNLSSCTIVFEPCGSGGDTE